MQELSMIKKARFWAKVHKINEGCWVWMGSKNGTGYGQVVINYKPYYVHRVSYLMHNNLKDNSIPKGMVIMHLCDNRACVNPDHLKLGSQKENIHDAISKDRVPQLTKKVVV